MLEYRLTFALALVLIAGPATAQQDGAAGPPAIGAIHPADLRADPASPEALPLGTPELATYESSGQTHPPSSALGEVASLALPLAGVIAMIIGLAALVRRAARAKGGLLPFGAAAPSPSGVVEVLARYPLGRGQSLMLLRVHRRVLLIAHPHARADASPTTLAEFTGADDVASLLTAVSEGDQSSLAQRFTRALEREQAEQESDVPIPMAPRPARTPAPSLAPQAGDVVGGPSAVQSLRAQLARLQHNNRGRAA